MMRSWQIQDAKARFSELLDLCQTEGPQLVTKRGAEAAVLVPVAKWRRLQGAGRPTLKEMLLVDHPRGDFDILERGQLQSRDVADLDWSGIYLLDTNVASELRRVRPHGAVLAWVLSIRDADLHLSAVTIGKLQIGVERTRDRDAAKAAELEAWITQVVNGYKILPMDGPAFREWARLMRRRSSTLAQDAMIAATATVHDLVVATRNVRDFAPLGIRTVNPFEV